MGKKKGLVLPLFAGLTLLVMGLALVALVVILPLPEERAYQELSQIKIKTIRWDGLLPSKAVEELNREIQKVSDTRYRFFFAKEADDNAPFSIELNDVTATEVAGFISQLGSGQMYGTPQGPVIDRPHQGALYDKPSWRRDFRRWLTHILPYEWQLWRHPPRADPFAPVPSPSPPPSSDLFAPVPAPSK